MYNYCSADVQNTMDVYNRLKLSALESKIKRLRDEYDSCDDYMMRESISKKIRRVKSEFKKLQAHCICNY